MNVSPPSDPKTPVPSGGARNTKVSKGIACDACRRRKIRCDRQHPCNRCQSQQITCLYTAIPQKRGPRAKRESVIQQLRLRPELANVGGLPQSAQAAGVSPSDVYEDSSKRAESEQAGQLLPRPNPMSWGAEVPKDWTKYPRVFLDELLFDYFTEIHPITPILNQELVSSYLNHRPTPLTCCLIYGLCFLGSLATTQKLSPEYAAASHELLADATRFHNVFLFAANPCTETVMAAYNLWVAHYRTCNFKQSFVYVREAITLAQMMGLDRKEHYYQLNDENIALQHHVLFHTLYTSERGAYMQFPHLFRLTIASECLVPFPQHIVEQDEDYRIVIGLAKVHSVADDISQILNRQSSSASLSNDPTQPRVQEPLAPGRLLALLHRLESSRSQYHRLPHDIQRADFLISNLWFRVHVLRLSGDALYTLALQSQTFRSIQEDLSMIADNLSKESIEAHGTNIFLKLCDIMETLSSLYVAIDGTAIYDQSIVHSTIDTRIKIGQILRCIRKVTHLPLNPYYLGHQLIPVAPVNEMLGSATQVPFGIRTAKSNSKQRLEEQSIGGLEYPTSTMDSAQEQLTIFNADCLDDNDVLQLLNFE